MILLVFAQQIHIIQDRAIATEEISAVSQDNESEESKPESLLGVDQNIIASGLQLHVNHVFYEIMNIEQDEEEDNFENAGINSFSNYFTKVLFCKVISPNAP